MEATVRHLSLRLLASLVIVTIGTSRAGAQTGAAANHERTSAPANSRFELFQSTIAVRLTLRLDKYTGEFSQLVLAEDSTLTWQVVPRSRHSAPDTRQPGQVNYQILSSSIAIRHTYLLNVNTGATWQLVQSSDETLVWEPIS